MWVMSGVYLRGKNHLDDARLLSTGSHILKHYIQKHSEENPEDMRFKMRILSFKRSAYERQVHESVLIQQNRNHHLLNSKMEYNRCSLPRLTVKLGDKEMNDLVMKTKAEQKAEDELENIIKHWKKTSKKRKNNEPKGQPGLKRRKIENVCSNYSGSHEHLLCEISDKYDRRVDVAIDEALRLCDEIETGLPTECEEKETSCDEIDPGCDEIETGCDEIETGCEETETGFDEIYPGCDGIDPGCD